MRLSTVLDAVFAGDAHIEDICSSVGAQGWNINKQVPGVEPGSMSTLLLRRELERAAGVSSTGFFRLAHCWVLRQQGRMKLTAVWLEVARFRVVSDCSCADLRLPR